MSLWFLTFSALAEPHPKAKEVVQAAIEAMGGTKYLEVKNSYSRGRYFLFDRQGRKAFVLFQDWTVYAPVKSRYQLGEGKRQQVFIHNLEIGKGWSVEGEKEKAKVEEVPEEEMKDFQDQVQRNLDILLRKRVDEPQMHLYYYGSDEIAGAGDYEAVEFLDAANNSVVIFFERKSHLPSKLETHVTNKLGIREKHETEFSNWHAIQGVHTPLRIDDYVEGQIRSQQFIEVLTYNVDIPDQHFLEPKPGK